MKEIDDTPLPETESEVMIEVDFADLCSQVCRLIFEIQRLELRIAELETQRVANEYNTEDPEWH